MNKALTKIFLIVSVLFGSAGVSSAADYQRGLAAAQRGDFVAVKSPKARSLSEVLVRTILGGSVISSDLHPSQPNQTLSSLQTPPLNGVPAM